MSVLVKALAIGLPLLTALALPAQAGTDLVFTYLKMVNGWVAHGGGTSAPAAAIDSNNIVHLKGALSGGTEFGPAFKLPLRFRPNRLVYLYAAGEGVRVVIDTSGTAVVAPTIAGDAFALTSLEGLTYAKH